MEPITLVTCSGLSSTGKVTARAGMVVLQRFPGSVEECIPATRLQEPPCGRILALDSCEDACALKKLRETFPCANIVAIDYDSGASEVNQLNRIKLMVSTALKNLEAGKVNIDLGDLVFPRRIDGL